MSTITVFATVQPREGKAAALHAAIAELVAASEEEDGLDVYAAYAAEDGTVWFYEKYADQAAWNVHGRGERMRAALGPIRELAASRPTVVAVTPIAAKGGIG